MEPSTDQAAPDVLIHNDGNRTASGVRRTITAVLMVLTVGVAAYLLAGRPRTLDATNLVGLVGSEEIDATPLLESSQAVEIEDVLRRELGYRLLVPDVTGANIVGVGTWGAERNLRIPVVSYDDPQGDISKALVLNYAMLDKISGAVFLDRSVRLELEQDKSYAVVSASGSREIVLWRSGDDIFVAIAEKGAGRLIPRIVLPGSAPQG